MPHPALPSLQSLPPAAALPRAGLGRLWARSRTCPVFKGSSRAPDSLWLPGFCSIWACVEANLTPEKADIAPWLTATASPHALSAGCGSMVSSVFQFGILCGF